MPTPDTDDPVFRLQTALLGFHGARLRYRDESTRAGAHPETAIIPLTEALWWATSVDEGMEKVDGDGYKTARDAAGHVGDKMRALRYVRGRCGHQRALAIELKGATLPFTLPFTLGAMFRWRAAEELPAADSAHHERGKDKYQQWLAGRPALEILDEAASWFATACNRPESAVAQANAPYLPELFAQARQPPI